MRRVAERLTELDSAASLEKEECLQLLAKAANDPSPTVREKAIGTIAELGMREALPMVESLLLDSNEMVRYEAVQSLGNLFENSDGPHDALRSRLIDQSPLIRIQALESLAQIGDHGASPLVVKLLADEDPVVRAYAARVLFELDGLEYTLAIHGALDIETDDSALAGMNEALLLFGERERLGRFLELLGSSDYRVRCAVANSLERLPLDRDERERAIVVLSAAHRDAIGVADRSTVRNALNRMGTAAKPGQTGSDFDSD